MQAAMRKKSVLIKSGASAETVLEIGTRSHAAREPCMSALCMNACVRLSAHGMQACKVIS